MLSRHDIRVTFGVTEVSDHPTQGPVLSFISPIQRMPRPCYDYQSISSHVSLVRVRDPPALKTGAWRVWRAASPYFLSQKESPMRILSRMIVLGLAASILAGCQSTSIKSAWFDPGYTGGTMKKIVVIGVSSNVVNRRVFEDIFTQKLRAAGVDGIPGYTVIPDDARAAQAPFSGAVEKSGAQGALMVRLVGVDTKTQVSTTMVSGAFGWGPYGGMYGPGWYPVTEVNQYDVATVETSLYDVKTQRLVWGATTETFNPNSVAQETPGYADLIIKQL